MADLMSWLTLFSAPGVGTRRFHTLLAKFGSPEAALRASLTDLETTPGVGPQTATAIKSQRDWSFAEKQIKLAAEFGARLITLSDADYPHLLRHIFDPPPILYALGNLTRAVDRSVAIVGTRLTTSYGRQATEYFTEALVQRGFTVVSGLARGVDTVAHRAALACAGHTVAVIGSGLDRPYPRENRSLMEAIATSGIVLTEQPFGTGPDAMNFPLRNRIISGLSLGTLVIEAGEESGALITARYALEHNREIFALPGPVTSRQSAGVNRLIRDGLAKLVQTPDDVMQELSAGFEIAIQKVESNPAPELRKEEQGVYAVLSDEPSHIDQIATAAGITTSQALAVLLSLELRDIVSQIPGKRFARL